MTNEVNKARGISPFYLALLLIAFILSLTALYIAFQEIITQSEALDAYSFLAIGLGGLAFSVYMLFQTRSKPSQAIIEVPRVLTTLECPKCDFKNIRDFQREDFIFKKAGNCQKCNEPMTITAIYREPKKKE
ncbi:MAG: hypothetical protein IAX21_10695 [Candidatus Bathyarchaeota archaeon]|nr:hypothetical protein [Candidatus Bathyarchaeum tardum]WGM88658.1 MAG: hypothetical protein NUK63_06975 [Candidatus Bathyarchaeum tardum]WNZ29084.1 MAG: hypothetical protein IAX21_10695 [Candidatus Bathyarchaeota archaeon]